MHANLTATLRASSFGFVSSFVIRISSLIARFVIFRRFQEQSLECRCRSSALNQFRAGSFNQQFNFSEEIGRRIRDDKLGLIFDRNQFLEPAFANKHAISKNPDPIADFLRLGEQMRRKQNGDPAVPKINN